MSGTILLTGGTGLLGRHLRKLDPGIVAPTRREMNLLDPASIQAALAHHDPAIVIHAAAITRVSDVEAHRADAVRTNIIGTACLAAAAIERGFRLVYLSTDYLYPGTAGPHAEDEPLQPCNDYAWTKLGGEAAVHLVPDALIIRTSFGPRPYEYERAATDKITSRLYVDAIAPIVLELAISATTGVMNVGDEPRSMFDYARATRPDVMPVTLAELDRPVPKDTSLKLDKWAAVRSKGKRGASS